MPQPMPRSQQILVRYWWLRRIGIALVVWFAALAALWCLWAWSTHQRLSQMDAAYRAAGRPVHFTDLPGVAALQAPPFPEHTANSIFVRASRLAVPSQAIDLALTAVAAPDGQFRKDYRGGEVFLPLLSPLRDLAIVMLDEATRCHELDDDRRAVELFKSVLRLAHLMEKGAFLVEVHCGIGVEWSALERVAAAAPALRVGEKTGVSRDELNSLIDTLLAQPLIPTYHADYLRAATSHHFEAYGPVTFVLSPMIEAGIVRINTKLDRYAGSLAMSDPVASKRESTILSDRHPAMSRGSMPRWSRLADTYLPSLPNSLANIGQVQASRIMTATSLAVRLYAVDHGRLPNSLDELVPTYLRALPKDPDDPSRSVELIVIPAGLPDGRDRPMLRLVGYDGVAASLTNVPKVPMFSLDHRRPDHLIDLVRWSPADDAAEGDGEDVSGSNGEANED